MPSNFTVSIPTCINTSTPLSVVIPIAWNVGKNVVRTPLAGETIFPSKGSMAIPFPNAPQANASSSTFDNSFIFPFNGLAKTSCFTNVFSLFEESYFFEALPVISLSSNFTNNIPKNPNTIPAIDAIIIPKNAISNPFSPIKAGIANTPIPPTTYNLEPQNPNIPPVTAPTIQLKTNGFFLGNVIPYIAGSVTPKIPEIIAGIHNDFSFLFFAFNAIAITTPVCAKHTAQETATIVSYPRTDTLFIAMGTNPQCKPNITNICQKPPINIPAKTGLKL